MLHFAGLRLSGFKSFVDPVELAITPGMTGIVGPNGCGKSNLIEALRWAMGESSARQMRGGEMDDVIFGGTANRPPRNVAEVTIRLDNAADCLPARFAGIAEIEVARRIERGQGSSYRLNGSEIRARDVQLLFADAATGARSSGLVSQGRVGALINAKPSERRSLLEEAAGIAGLHSRRREAEGRLTGAETNLTRLDDILATLEDQLKELRKQARQAARYRTLSAEIRAVEAQILALSWLEALAAVDLTRAGLAAARQLVEVRTGEAAAAAAALASAGADLPGLRAVEAEAMATAQRLVAEREVLEAEIGRLAETRRDLDGRLAQALSDGERESARAADAAETVARLTAERDGLIAAGRTDADMRAEAEDRVEAAAEGVAAIERDLTDAMAEAAAADAERGAALRRLDEAETRQARLGDRAAQIAEQRARAAAEGIDRADLTAAEMELEAAQEYVEEAHEESERAGRARTESAAAAEAARDRLREQMAARDRLKAEIDALASVLASPADGFSQVLDQISAMAGDEAALAAALGEDLSASLEDGAPVRWTELPPMANAPLPDGVQPLARRVTAPAALGRRLSQVGMVADAETARALQAALGPGQRLVTPAGDLVRWDGLVKQAGAPDPMAVRLAQRNRMREIEMRLDDAELGIETAEAAATEAGAAAVASVDAETRARESARRAEGDLARARDAHAALAQRFAQAETRLAALVEQEDAVRADLEEAAEAVLTAQAAVAAFPEDGEGRDRIAGLRADLAERRSGLVEARSLLDRCLREAGERARRLEGLETDIASWTKRAEAARAHLDELDSRRAAIEAEIARLAALPGRFDERRAQLLDRIAEADAARRQAADALVTAENRVGECERAARAAETALAEAREDAIRREADLGAAEAGCRAVAARIAERLDVTPEQALALADFAPGIRPDRPDLERRFDRLSRERDSMGAVNLRAENEVAELEARLGELAAEKDDLIQAIGRLRQAIGELNREGRERLQASFEAVDRHFRDLFVRLFGGGRAHLSFVDSPDPLQAGLEIMASPPGKRLQALSLLSGGEQALTALALLFAVFMTNPAPICVLDEVDAPLDDANVDRFCTLLETMCQSTGTRFLVVTHHRMTMARMDRLFGVTMAERGVSQLVSVDLARAEALVPADEARQLQP